MTARSGGPTAAIVNWVADMGGLIINWVVAVGDCAANGGIFAGSYAVAGGVKDVIPVDLHIRGCPPRPCSLNRSAS